MTNNGRLEMDPIRQSGTISLLWTNLAIGHPTDALIRPHSPLIYVSLSHYFISFSFFFSVQLPIFVFPFNTIFDLQVLVFMVNT